MLFRRTKDASRSMKAFHPLGIFCSLEF